MLRRLLHVRTGVATGLLACLSVPALGQEPLAKTTITIPLATPAPLEEKQVKAWSRELVGRLDEIWTETKPALREQKLNRLVENTPAELAFVTRVFHRNRPNLSAVTLTSLKDVFAVLRNTQWGDRDAESVQKVVAGWSVMVPELVKMIGRDDTTADMRRAAEAVLVDLGHFSRDARLGSPPARQAWQAQRSALAELTRHPRTTARLAALHILESLGPDATPAAAAVVQALGDSDRFVRWSAVQTLQAAGMDATAMQAVATLQKDDDSDVRAAAIAAVLGQPGGSEVLGQTKNASPLRRTSLDQPAVSKWLRPPPTAPIRLTETKEANLPEVSKKPETVARTFPQNRTGSTVLVMAPPKPAEPAPTLTEATSTPPRQSTQTRQIFTSSTPAAEAAGLGSSTPAPAQPRVASDAAPAHTLPSVQLPSPPQMARVVQPAPTPILLPPTPVLLPLPPTRTETAVRPVSATVAAPVKIDLADLWLKKLASGNPRDQVVALRELGKMKQGAAHCVPQMAELLVNSDVNVRREVPLALLEVGPEARIATALLERALNDSDTQVKVNAARCLVELAATK